MHKLIRHYEKRMNERKQSLPKHDISCGRMTEAGRTETHDRNEVNMDDDDDETHRNGNITSSPDDNEHNVRQNKMKSPVPQSRKKSDEVPATPTETPFARWSKHAPDGVEGTSSLNVAPKKKVTSNDLTAEADGSTGKGPSGTLGSAKDKGRPSRPSRGRLNPKRTKGKGGPRMI